MGEELAMVTYTFNDARLADGLLRSVPTWSVRPQRVLVVDDGSATAYAPPQMPEGAPPVAIERLDENRGPAGAKAHGLAAVADSDMVLSVDCDIRPAPYWVARAKELLAEEGVGLVGGIITCDAGSGPTARYMARYDILDFDPQKTGFLTGNIWLMRGEVWTAVGGFGAHSGPTHEDFAFCRRLAEQGYVLRRVEDAPVRQVRRMSRRALAAQHSRYTGASVRAVVERKSLWDGLGPIVQLVSMRMSSAVQRGEDVFVYMELLLFARLMLDLFAARTRFVPQGLLDVAEFRAALMGRLEPYPTVRGLLADDLADASPAPPGGGTGARDVWETLLDMFTPFIRAGVFDRLEREGVATLRREDAENAFDFHYLAPNADAPATDGGVK